jgi:DNA-binding response OmpR family regulator
MLAPQRSESKGNVSTFYKNTFISLLVYLYKTDSKQYSLLVIQNNVRTREDYVTHRVVNVHILYIPI